MDTTEVTSIRLPNGSIQQLRRLAHQVSLARGKDVSWSALVREAVAALLLAPAAQAKDAAK
jgi:hypothetical protein